MLVYLSLDIICSSRLTVYHKHPSQITVRILELVIRRQISVHIFAPNGGYYWQGCFWTLRCFYIYSQGVPRLFQNSDPLSTTRPTKVICLQRRNRRLYDRESHSFVGSKSTFPYQRIVYVVLKTTFKNFLRFVLFELVSFKVRPKLIPLSFMCREIDVRKLHHTRNVYTNILTILQ